MASTALSSLDIVISLYILPSPTFIYLYCLSDFASDGLVYPSFNTAKCAVIRLLLISVVSASNSPLDGSVSSSTVDVSGSLFVVISVAVSITASSVSLLTISPSICHPSDSFLQTYHTIFSSSSIILDESGSM